MLLIIGMETGTRGTVVKLVAETGIKVVVSCIVPMTFDAALYDLAMGPMELSRGLGVC